MAKALVIATGKTAPYTYTVFLSDGKARCPISPAYNTLTEAKIFRKGFEAGRAHPEPLYTGWPVEFVG